MFLIGGDTYDILGFGAGERVVGLFLEHISSADAYHFVGSLLLKLSCCQQSPWWILYRISMEIFD